MYTVFMVLLVLSNAASQASVPRALWVSGPGDEGAITSAEERPRAGVMVAAGKSGVLALAGAALPAGTAVTLVTIDSPQEVSYGVITKPLADSEIMAKHLAPGPYYQIASASGTTTLPDLAVAILGRLEAERGGAAVAIRFGRSADIRVRGCTSSEGLHLTLWAGEPLKSTRLWHTYYYLGYDVEPDCRPAEAAPDRSGTADLPMQSS